MPRQSLDVLILSCGSAMSRAEGHASPHDIGLPGELATHRAGGATPHESGQTHFFARLASAGVALAVFFAFAFLVAFAV